MSPLDTEAEAKENGAWCYHHGQDECPYRKGVLVTAWQRGYVEAARAAVEARGELVNA